MNSNFNGLEIAVIGLAGKFAGGETIEDFWRNLENGVELITPLTDGETRSNGIERFGAVLKDVDRFDAAFFGFNPKEAETMDPQHRLFLESAWEALENAGYSSENEERAIGVFAGVGMGTYLLYNLSPNPGLIESRGFLPTLVGVDKDYLPTRVSYKLNLKGPSISMGTACSSSLVAVHLACQSLLSGECDMALAAGVAVKVPQSETTLSPDEIVSPDGHCRAFDCNANGTVGGNGLGIVVLKRLEDAIADRDRIYAVVKGSAINNDGAMKVGYTAPSQEGQAKVIRAAQLMAEVEPETISYMETHGTGTALGDPIEVAAMTQAFRASTDLKQFCAIGSVKTNIGHLDAAAGITGFIKTVLALHHKRIPPSLHFETPNPQIDFASSPFYVNTKLTEWETNGTPRRAGVSSFGFGGTNVHAILEEAPPLDPATSQPRAYQLLALSAKTATALDRSTVNLSDRLKQSPELNLADVAYTLQMGRWAFDRRRFAIVSSLDNAVQALSAEDSPQVFTGQTTASNPPIMLMFSGQGSQYVNMGRELYESEATFRSDVDRCLTFLQSQHDIDLRSVLFADSADLATATHQLTQTAIAQPALFTIEYALAQLWMSWGVTPQGAIGHSIGEYVAACLAGVFSLEDALTVVVTRGILMQQQPTGTMLAVHLAAADLQPLLDDTLYLAAHNSPTLNVVSGTVEAIAGLESLLATRGITCRPLHTSHAFHSPLMEGAIEPFVECLRQITLHPPQLPFISNVTGTWITPAAATDPCYWVQHLRQPVQFAAGMAELLTNTEAIFLEVGAGRTLGTLTKQQAPDRTILYSLPHPQDKSSDLELMLKTLGQLWLSGVEVDWTSFYADRECQRVPLPTYPFDRQRYWIDAPALNELNRALVTPVKKADIGDWFYVPSWKRAVSPAIVPTDRSRCWVIFSARLGFADSMAQRLQQQGDRVIEVEIGTQFSHNNDIYTIDPSDLSHYETLMQSVLSVDRAPIITHLWTLGADLCFEESQTLGFYSLLYLAQAIGHQNSNDPIHIGVVTSNSQDVTGTETIQPETATILGACRVIPQEYPHISCCAIDMAQRLEVVAGGAKSACLEKVLHLGKPQERTFRYADWDIDRTIAEILTQAKTSSDPIVAYRGNYRWLPIAEPLYLNPVESPTSLRNRGVYLITGGMGGIGLTIATHLAQTIIQPKLILIGRSPFPDRAKWESWLTTHDEADKTSIKIRQLQSLQAIGAEILVLNADVADLAQMAAIQGQIQQTYGQINGIFHTAGIPGDGIIQLKTPETAANVMRPKVQGTLVLERIYRDKHLDFLVLFSSHSALLGGMGQIDYCAANNFLDAFALAQNRNPNYRTISIDWDIWQEVGMGADLTGLPTHLKQERLAALATGIAPAAGWEALQRILHSDLDRAIVSTQDWQTVLKQQQQRTVSTAATPQPSPEQTTAAEHTRSIQTAYIAPSTEIEQRIAQLWQNQLGIAQIGANDNFFELGGHSLLAVRIVSQLREIYPVDLSLRTLLSEAPTVAGLAAIIADLLCEPDDPDEMIRLLAEIENLSIDEVRDRLDREQAIS
ncbi:type I polyketide synthase [Chamaesiphon minutus]|uniref:Polyketide synthase family protein n=1 Tax=Chamaesiphon minutus (strain ATCC 27169 / PCC 6605) TaxID=1173020 RepID=K9UFS1_CHAP6|nr:type I polyketide synthase [Chamaesiphon minutus]AFY93670.1 polyketide synthase family protein [Chamaesiphon minutus PCC 6605]